MAWWVGWFAIQMTFPKCTKPRTLGQGGLFLSTPGQPLPLGARGFGPQQDAAAVERAVQRSGLHRGPDPGPALHRASSPTVRMSMGIKKRMSLLNAERRILKLKVAHRASRKLSGPFLLSGQKAASG